MRFLPNETWFDVLHFVPFRHLHQSISLVSARFSALSQPLLDTLCPRSVNYLIIKWNSELRAPYLELVALDKSAHSSRGLPKVVTKSLPFPKRPPPDNIIKIKEIHIEAHFDQRIVELLLQCSPKIISYHVMFYNFGNFTRELAADGIQMQQFLDAMGKNCSSMGFCWAENGDHEDRDDLMPPIDSEQLLHCSCLEFLQVRSPLNGPTLIKWLKEPLAKGIGRGLIVRSAKECTDREREKITEQIRMMIYELIGDQQHNESADTIRYIVMLFDIKLAMEPFRDGELELCKWSEGDWALINGVGPGPGEEENEEEDTLIKVGHRTDWSS